MGDYKLDLVLEVIKEFELDWYNRHPDGKYVQEHWDEYQQEKREWINEWLRAEAEAEKERIELLEEEQERNGFYRFQDEMDMWRRER